MMKAVSILAVAAVLGASGAAADHQPMRSVNYADLNLQTPAGIAALEQRIDRAARSLCAVPVTPRSMWLDKAREQCMAETIAASRSGIDLAVRMQRTQMTQTAASE